MVLFIYCCCYCCCYCCLLVHLRNCSKMNSNNGFNYLLFFFSIVAVIIIACFRDMILYKHNGKKSSTGCDASSRPRDIDSSQRGIITSPFHPESYVADTLCEWRLYVPAGNVSILYEYQYLSEFVIRAYKDSLNKLVCSPSS